MLRVSVITLNEPSCCLVNATPCKIRQGMLHREKQIAWVNLLKKLYESYMVSQFPCVGAAINKFMQYYRTTIPTATIHPKLHFLEDHAVDFIKKWGTGFGFLGEQGGESVHAVFNSLQRAYNNIPMVLTDFSTWSGSITAVSALRTFRKLPPHPKESRLSRTPVLLLSFLTIHQIIADLLIYIT